MKYEDIFAAISHRYDTFTRMEQNIADYVLEHGKDVLDMSISTLPGSAKWWTAPYSASAARWA